MGSTDSTKARLGLTIVFGLSFAFGAIHIAHALEADENIETFMYGILIPLGVTVLVFFAGAELWRHADRGEAILRVGAWTLGGVIVMANVGLLTVLYQHAEGVHMSDPLFIIANSATGGALVGFIVGSYDVRQQTAALKADRLNRKLTVLNRVLRHDLRTKATTIQGHARLLSDDTDSTADSVQTIRSETADLVELGSYASDLEQLFQQEQAELEPIDLTPLVRDSWHQLEQRYPEAEIDLSLPTQTMVEAHSLLPLAIENVLENGLEHNDAETPRLEIRTRTISTAESTFVELQIADNGPGIPEREIEILRRGFETDLDHMSGLGLWVVNWIVASSDGHVEFEANEPRGSVVHIRLRAAEQAPA